MGEIATILGASCGAPQTSVLAYSIDSRAITRGALFFAIRGPHFDGHDFVAQALEKGVAGAVVEHAFRERALAGVAANLISVPDTTDALQQLAHAARQRWGRRLVAITGSTGKTTTKELTAALLGTRFKVHKSPGNLNNYYGLPLTLLALEPEHDTAVVELAMSAPGEIARLARIAEPEIGVMTNVAPVHLEFFDSLDSIARAKHELIENLKQPATAVLNHDDVRVREFGKGFSGRVVTYGFGKGADFHAHDFQQVSGQDSAVASQFNVTTQDFSCEFVLHLPGRHNVLNALAALATARLYDVTVDEIRRALAEFRSVHQRAEIIRLDSGITLIDDSYNSNPLAMTRMLETLASWPGAQRRLVVAGEMLELGPTAPELHREVGRQCVETRVDWLIAIQGDARFFVEGAIEAGIPAEQTRFFADAAGAGEFCRSLVKAGDVILVKGSRGVHLEKAVEVLASGEKRNVEMGVTKRKGKHG